MGIGASTTAAVDEGDFDSTLTDHLAVDHNPELQNSKYNADKRAYKPQNAYTKTKSTDINFSSTTPSSSVGGGSSEGLAIRPIASPVGSPNPEMLTAIHGNPNDKHPQPPTSASRGIFAAMFGRGKDSNPQVNPASRLSQSASSAGVVLGGESELSVGMMDSAPHDGPHKDATVTEFEFKFQLSPPLARELIPLLPAPGAPLNLTAALASQLHSITAALPKDIKLVGEFNPSPAQMQIENNTPTQSSPTPTQPPANDLVLLNAIKVAGGNRAYVRYIASLSLQPGRYRYYYFVDNRPELASDQPVELERNVMVVAPKSPMEMAVAAPSSMAASSNATMAKSMHAGSTKDLPGNSVSPSSVATAIPSSVGGKRGGPSHISASPAGWADQYSSSLPSSSLDARRRVDSSGRPNVGGAALFPEVSGSLARPPSTTFGRKDPFDDEEGWGQEIPQALLTTTSADSLPNPAMFTGPSSPPGRMALAPTSRSGPVKNTQISPMELPAHLERALLNAAPVAGDPGMLPLPHHVMLNHLYERPPSSHSWTDDGRADHVILGLTVRYKDDRFVTLVLYKPIPEVQTDVFD